MSLRNVSQSAVKNQRVVSQPKKTNVVMRNEAVGAVNSHRHARVSLLGQLPGLNDPTDIFKIQPQPKKPGVVLMAQRPKKFWKIVERVYDMMRMNKSEMGLTYNAQSFNYIADIPLEKKIYLLDSRGDTNLKILLEMHVDPDSRAVCGKIRIYE